MKEQSNNKMAVMPVGRLMLTTGIPMILSMMLQAVYNIVDSAFVSNMSANGEAALNALTLAFPVQMLMVAIGIGTGVGTNALLARSLGEQNFEKANRTSGNSIFLGIVIYMLFLLFGIFGTHSYIASQSSNPLIIEMASSYLRICCVFSMGNVFYAIFEKLLQATGRSLFSTISQVAGAVVNIILDPILIYGLCGLPEMGVEGAAYATVIGQIASCIIGLCFHLKYNTEITNKLSYLRPSPSIIREIYSIGLPAIIAQALMAFMTYGLNVILGTINEAIVTAYGLYYKIQQFILFAAFGLRDAITPIISYNYGMRSKKRIQDGIRYGMKYTLIIMCAGLLLAECSANLLASLFGLSGNTEVLCISAIRIVSLSFLFAGANVAYQGIFQALESGLESLCISVCRQFLLVLPVAWGFSLLVRYYAAPVWIIWTTFLIAEGLSFLLAAFFMKKIRRRSIDPIA